MNSPKRIRVVAIAMAGLLAPAFAGPPMVCVPFECEGQLLDENPRHPSADKLQAECIRVLDDSSTVIQRMENLRRAAVIASRTDGAPEAVFSSLSWRALSAEASGDTRAYADALFDAGYFAATLANLGVRIDGSPGAAKGIEGYAWMRRAIALANDDPSMHFGAALAAHPAMRDSKRDLFDYHISRAAAGAQQDPVLAKNLEANMRHFGESLDRTLAKTETGRDGG